MEEIKKLPNCFYCKKGDGWIRFGNEWSCSECFKKLNEYQQKKAQNEMFEALKEDK